MCVCVCVWRRVFGCGAAELLVYARRGRRAAPGDSRGESRAAASSSCALGSRRRRQFTGRDGGSVRPSDANNKPTNSPPTHNNGFESRWPRLHRHCAAPGPPLAQLARLFPGVPSLRRGVRLSRFKRRATATRPPSQSGSSGLERTAWRRRRNSSSTRAAAAALQRQPPSPHTATTTTAIRFAANHSRSSTAGAALHSRTAATAASDASWTPRGAGGLRWGCEECSRNAAVSRAIERTHLTSEAATAATGGHVSCNRQLGCGGILTVECIRSAWNTVNIVSWRIEILLYVYTGNTSCIVGCKYTEGREACPAVFIPLNAGRARNAYFVLVVDRIRCFASGYSKIRNRVKM